MIPSGRDGEGTFSRSVSSNGRARYPSRSYVEDALGDLMGGLLMRIDRGHCSAAPLPLRLRANHYGFAMVMMPIAAERLVKL